MSTIEVSPQVNEISLDTQTNEIVVQVSGNNTITISDTGIQGPVGNASWGQITGTLSDQADLQAALDVKLTTDDSNIIDLANSGDSTLVYTGSQLTSINYVDTPSVTANSKSLIYTGDKRTSLVQIFTYDSQVWTVTTTLTYTGDLLTGKTVSVVKV